MRKLNFVKFLATLLLQLGLITMSHVSNAGTSTEGSVPGTCDTTNALKVLDSDSCVVFGPNDSDASGAYQVALVTNYAVSGCLTGTSVITSAKHAVYISSFKLKTIQDDSGTLNTTVADGSNSLLNGEIGTFANDDTIGEFMKASGEATYGEDTNACEDIDTGKIATPILQMNGSASEQHTLSAGGDWASNWVDLHHNGGSAYEATCAFDDGSCTYAKLGTASAFNPIQTSGKFPASQLSLIIDDVNPQKLPGDTATFEVILTSVGGTDTLTTASYAIGSATQARTY